MHHPSSFTCSLTACFIHNRACFFTSMSSVLCLRMFSNRWSFGLALTQWMIGKENFPSFWGKGGVT